MQSNHTRRSHIFSRSLEFETTVKSLEEIQREYDDLMKEYKFVYNSIPDLLCYIDLQGYISRMNNSWSLALGWRTDEILPHPFYELVHPNDRAQVIKVLLYPISAERTSCFEARLRCTNGTYKYFEWHCRFIPHIQKHFCIIRDASEREQAVGMLQQTREELEERLYHLNTEKEFYKKQSEEYKTSIEKSEQYHTILFDLSPIAQAIFDSDGRILHCNMKFLSLFGFRSQQEASSILLEKLFQQQELFITAFEQIKQRKQPVSFESILFHKDGLPLNVYCNFNIITLSANNAEEYHGYFSDRTEQKRIESYLTQKQRTEVLGTVARGIAHDFNNILGIILGYLTMLNKKGITEERVISVTEQIQRVVDRGTDLTKQILTFSQKADALPQLVDVNKEIEHLTKMMRATFPKKIQLVLQLASNLPPIQCVRGQLHQALLNLCINARDAILEKNTESTNESITLRSFFVHESEVASFFSKLEKQSYVAIEITDSGKGMEPALLSKIFEPFFTTKSHGQGTGLGLAVVDLIVKSHHAHIDVQSESGKGTTIRLYFPASQQGYTEQPNESKEYKEETGGKEMLLFAEDELALAYAMKQHLESKGYTILLAHDGTEALEMYSLYKDTIALAIVDLDLPILDGMKVFQKIRRMNPTQKVIIASGYLDAQEQSRFLEHGVSGFIQKPYQPNDLLKVIRNVLDNPTIRSGSL